VAGCKHDKGVLDSVNDREGVDQLINYQLVKTFFPVQLLETVLFNSVTTYSISSFLL
jgi:hypothetical protein